MTPLPGAGPSRRTTAWVVALLCLIWGSTWIVIAQGLKDLPPLTSAAARFLLAACGMTIVAGTIGRRESGERPGWRLSLVMGTLNFGASYGIVYWSETVLPSGLVSLLWAVFPIMMAVLGSFYLEGDRLVPRQWAGFALGFLGVFVLFRTDLAHLPDGAVAAGSILLLSPLVSAFGNAYVKKHAGGVRSLVLNRNGMAIGAVLLSTLAFVCERDAQVAWTPSAIASILYLALVGTVSTFGLFFWLLRYAPASQMSLIAYVTPVVALTLGTLVGGEPFHLHTLAGAALVLVGVLIAVRR
ncbi:MAG: EamA family transporter [Planctomycetes bacterium]|nr:EamA family transporter [Planctomycetota bacterium]